MAKPKWKRLADRDMAVRLRYAIKRLVVYLRKRGDRGNRCPGYAEAAARITDAHPELGPLPKGRKESCERILAAIDRLGLRDAPTRLHPPKRRTAKRGRATKPRDEFLWSFAWRQLRMKAILKHGNRCQCCGSGPQHGVKINVDHIKPRRDFPDLALCLDNLQVLCDACNHGKGNWDQTDWRP